MSTEKNKFKKFRKKKSIEMHSSGSRVSVSRYQPSLHKASKSKQRSDQGPFLSIQGEAYLEGTNPVFQEQNAQSSNQLQVDAVAKKMNRGTMSMDVGHNDFTNPIVR